MRLHFSPFFSNSSATSALVSVPSVRSSFNGSDGEGEDGGPGAGEEGDGEGEGEEVRPGRFFLEVCLAAGLDPGRLDALGDSSGRH